ncbi:hypothetical protein R6Z07F_013710 [Ovis aries]
MITEFLSLLCLGLCLGNEDEENNGNQKESKPTPEKTDTRIVFGATFSCLSLFLLFLAVFFIYRCTQQDSSEEESIKRTCHSKVHKQRDADVPMLERISELVIFEDFFPCLLHRIQLYTIPWNITQPPKRMKRWYVP